MKLFHVLTAFWYVAGVIGRDYTFWRAGKVEFVLEVQGLLRASEFFERRGAISGGMIVLVFGLLVTWARGWPLFGFLQGSDANWLLASFVLMVTKPF